MSKHLPAGQVQDLPQALVELSPTHDSVITGEAVALELQSASVLTRALSGLLDAALYGAIALTLGLLGTRFAQNQAQAQTLGVITLVCAMVGFPLAVETITRGHSMGKLALGVRVVRDDGGSIHFRHAFVRVITGVMELWLTFGGLALIAGVMNRQGKRLGDMLAGTYVVRTRGSEEAITPLLMPPDLAQWAQQVDVRALPNHLALAGRRFLARTGTLNEQVRAQMAQELAASFEPYVYPAPPWGVHPERFIAAVLVARRDREFASYQANSANRGLIQHQIQRLGFGLDTETEAKFSNTDYLNSQQVKL